MASTDVLRLAKIDPEIEEAFTKYGPPPPFPHNITAGRAALASRAALRNARSTADPNIRTKDATIAARDGHPIPIRTYAPKSAPASGCPLVVLLHSGGWVFGGLDGLDADCRLFVQTHSVVCVNVDYRLAPEHPFPVPVQDCWDVIIWVTENASLLGADPSVGFILGGVSAGGNLADVLCHLARDEKLSPPVTGLLLMVPILLRPEIVPEKYNDKYLSYEQNEYAPGFPKATFDWCFAQYAPDVHSSLFSSFNNSAGHTGLPPVFLQACGMDTLRDDALIYENVLRTEGGVKTKLEVYPGTPHGFRSVYPSLQISRKFVGDMLKGMAWLLGRE